MPLHKFTQKRLDALIERIHKEPDSVIKFAKAPKTFLANQFSLSSKQEKLLSGISTKGWAMIANGLRDINKGVNVEIVFPSKLGWVPSGTAEISAGQVTIERVCVTVSTEYSYRDEHGNTRKGRKVISKTCEYRVRTHVEN